MKEMTFIEFLENNGVNFDDRAERDVELYFPSYWVKYMVDFEAAPEGKNFWTKLDKAWKKYISKQLIVSFGNENN
jgi:hypothetical protein